MTLKRKTLREHEVLAIDCQATHSNPDKGHILEIGWVKTSASAPTDIEIISKDVETFLLKIPRGVEIPKAVLRITGIPDEELESARLPKEVWQRLSRVTKGIIDKATIEDTSQTNWNKTLQILTADNYAVCPAVIHFCRYEEPFLRKLHNRFSPGRDFPLSIFCTHEIVKRLIPGLPRKSLRAVAGYFGFSLPESRRCFHHVLATSVIWFHLVNSLEDTHDIHTFDELLDWLRQPVSYSSNIKGAREYPMAEVLRKDLPNLPGIYRMSRSGGDLLYIGKAKSLKQRINSYFHKGGRHPEHILEMLSQARSLGTTVTRTAVEAALVESDEIKRFSPPYNRALRTNEREARYFSRDLKSSNPQPDNCHSIGPLPSSYNVDPLILLGNVMVGDLRKISLKVVEGILDIPPEYLPARDCFVQGVKAFKLEFQKSLQPGFDFVRLMSLGAQFWKEKLEEQAAEEVAKKEAAEAAMAKKEALESAVKMGALGGDNTNESETEEVLELKMLESEDKEIEDTWTPERIVKVLKSIIRLSAFQIRRSRWFCRLSESSLVWMTAAGDEEGRNLIVFKGGTPIFKDPLSSSETVPLPPGHKKPLVERQKNFDLLVYDRMRVATTEIRRLLQEGRRIELWLHPDVFLRNEQLKRMLQWL
jgi:DNA polymerase-3 subunit epsilon